MLGWQNCKNPKRETFGLLFEVESLKALDFELLQKLDQNFSKNHIGQKAFGLTFSFECFNKICFTVRLEHVPPSPTHHGKTRDNHWTKRKWYCWIFPLITPLM